ncbi:MAG: hypothetical protein R2706_01220 [Acidimicrobiales bacterium]
MSVLKETPVNHGTVRFETNRSFTGMGHERYTAGDTIIGNRPPDEIAKILLGTGQVTSVHVYAQTVTCQLASGSTSDGLKELIEGLYTHYKPGVEVPSPESFG